MTWFLENPNTRVDVADCYERMLEMRKELTHLQFDLIFADPPFNIGVKYGGSDTSDDALSSEEYQEFTFKWMEQACWLLKSSGSLWINVPDELALLTVVTATSFGMDMKDWCIWHYKFGQCTDRNFIRSKTHALHFITDQTVPEPAWYPEQIKEESVRQQMGDKRAKDGGRVPMDVWYGENWGRVQGNNKERRPLHPNQLPEKYLERVILSCTKPGDLVLDPFLGSGTTCVVARALGRQSWGIEKDEKLAASAWERIEKVGAIRIPT